MSVPVITALIAAAAALIGVAANLIMTWRLNRRQTEMESFKADVQARLNERNALTSYQFEARRRLYEECEPLFFQLKDAADDALRVFADLSRVTFQRRLIVERENRYPGGYWMMNESSALIYALFGILRPMAIYCLLQQRMTGVDFSVDASAAFRYYLARQLFTCYHDDVQIARLKPARDYEPLVDEWRAKRIAEPAKHWWQGTTPGRLDNGVRLLIAGESAEQRVIRFGEFEDLYVRTYQGSNVVEQKRLGVVANPLYGFTPEDRPVFWRLMTIKAHIYAALVAPMPPNVESITASETALRDYFGKAMGGRPHQIGTQDRDGDRSATEWEPALAYLAERLVRR